MAYGTMGGDGQPQTQAGCSPVMSHSGSRSTGAIDAPRWLLGRTWGSAAHQSSAGRRVSTAIWSIGLLSAGSRCGSADEGYSDTMGHAGAVVLHPDGTFGRRRMTRAPTAARRASDLPLYARAIRNNYPIPPHSVLWCAS